MKERDQFELEMAQIKPAENARLFLSGLDETEKESSEVMAEMLLHDGPLADCVVAIPVAAAQEAHNVYRSLECYSGQEPNRSFTVVLGLNSTESYNHPAVQQTVAEIVRAKSDFPSLDVRHVFTEYMGDLTIGGIRRDIWNGILRAGVDGETITDRQDILTVNHDIDTHKLARGYMTRVQDYADDPYRKTVPTYTESRHAFDPSTPNISAFVYWNDFLHRNNSIGYEAGVMIPMSYYSKNGGFDASRRTHEVGSFVGKDARGALWRTGMLSTSPRRFQARLKEAGPSEIWTNESFGSDDDCRDEYFEASDINQADLEDSVTQLDYLLPGYVTKGPPLLGLAEVFLSNSKMTPDEFSRLHQNDFELRKKIAKRVLTSCVKVPSLDDWVDQVCSDQDLEATVVASARDLSTLLTNARDS